MTDTILIIGPTWIGDMMMAQSLFMTLKRERPGVTIDVVAPGWSLPLLARMPQVRKATATPFDRGELALGQRRAFGRSLRGEGYSQAIVLPNSLKSALVPWFAGIPRRTGWRGEMRYGLLDDLRRLDKQRFPMMVDRFNALAFDADTMRSADDFPQPHPNPSLVADKGNRDAAIAKFGLVADVPVLALCPGAEFGVSKRWPPEKYAEIVDMAGTGKQIWLFGSANDTATCDEILAHLEPEVRRRCHNLAGKTSLAEAVDLLSMADGVVTNDSGLMHVAAALGRPLVAVYGSTSPDFTPPLSDASRIVRLGLDCSPCFKRECPLGHHNCMRALPASMVHEALDEMVPAR
ncbi:lipopolysaccharide heptosyltransferase II [Mesorhizobium sp. CAU 1732]|uniref:lipopolysaccharide heptosyltransferase II n=1 Tax=Mesorhizobium sp. CAU 1732 TaxID=3140358 RepID=UPI003260F38D